ncbi:MAG: transcriptional repressor [Mobilitalea sp.]
MEQNTFLYKEFFITKGIKDTIQRRLILTELINSGVHMTAEEIHKNLKDKKIGLATVYRNLSIFYKYGILKEIPVNGVTYYELKLYNQKPLHIHCKCSKCNSMVDIDDTEINSEYLKINQKVMQKYDLDITDANFILSGLCDRCKSTNS